MTAAEVASLREQYEAGRQDWDILKRAWYSTRYRYYDFESMQFEEGYYRPLFPGAPRQMSIASGFFNGAQAGHPQWVVDIGLELPPALVPGNLTNPFPYYVYYAEEERGFYPPLKRGVNVVWAADVDMTDLSLRPECPNVALIEILATAWVWPNMAFAESWSIHSYEQFLAQVQPYPSRPARPIDQGNSMVWDEERQRAYFRATDSTPYGWYTFDIELMEMRAVDTAPDSWDTINLWGDKVTGAFGFGRSYYRNLGVAQLPDGIEPWPEFDPWVEALVRGELPVTPGAWTHSTRYFEPRENWLSPDDIGIAEYMRITCE